MAEAGRVDVGSARGLAGEPLQTVSVEDNRVAHVADILRVPLASTPEVRRLECGAQTAHGSARRIAG